MNPVFRPAPSTPFRSGAPDVLDLLSQFQTVCRALVRCSVVAGPNLSDAQLTILDEASSRRRGVSQVELAERLGLCGSSITRAIDSLQADNLVIRSVSHLDRRVRTISVTEEGRQLVEARRARQQHLASEVFSTLTLQEQDVLQTALRALSRRLSV